MIYTVFIAFLSDRIVYTDRRIISLFGPTSHILYIYYTSASALKRVVATAMLSSYL